ncbi:hypothetical protein Cob_v005134 [Colletotrichum orbiculare MAFF 240422]|uniref:Uncharacterized protein n=1 Tax=Colletotrichum orbiculare (strain 104-T / ATCC 96160 / CBS 514.97 / LARS 414 / MAFF 240422) TaxID=1213857 RepID=A0A484FW65_COLOR|nr:hypothetical protein Cob_v005134 [Colletotrichum orbiculare MAFF 240422]
MTRQRRQLVGRPKPSSHRTFSTPPIATSKNKPQGRRCQTNLAQKPPPPPQRLRSSRGDACRHPAHGPRTCGNPATRTSYLEIKRGLGKHLPKKDILSHTNGGCLTRLPFSGF